MHPLVLAPDEALLCSCPVHRRLHLMLAPEHPDALAAGLPLL